MQFITNQGLTDSALNRKKIDLIKSLTAMLFNVRFGESKNGSIKSIQNIERNIELLAKIENKPLFIENKSIIDDAKTLIFEIDLAGAVVNYAQRKTTSFGLGRMGYRKHTVKDVERLLGISINIHKIYKELNMHGYNIKGPVKNILDNIQKIINTILTNER